MCLCKFFVSQRYILFKLCKRKLHTKLLLVIAKHYRSLKDRRFC